MNILATNDLQKQKIINLVNSDRIAPAIKLLKKICKANEFDDEAWLLLGDLNGKLAKYSESIKCFKKAIKARPENDQAHFMLGFALQHMGKHIGAIDSYKAAIQINHNRSDARANLGSAMLMLNRYEEALDVSLDALKTEESDISAIMNVGNAYYGLNDFSSAEKYFRRALEIEPDNYDAHIGMGGVFEKKNDPVSAIDFYRSAVTLRPDSPQANNNLALALYSNMNPDEAIHYYKEAIRIDATYTPALLNLGLAYKNKGMMEDSEYTYNQILKIEPKNIAVLYNLGHIAELSGQLDKAINFYQRILSSKALGVDSEYFEAHKSMATIFLSLAEFDKGWEHYAYREAAVLKSVNDIDVSQLSGKTISIYGEQGLGDEIFFLRFAPLLQQQNIKIRYKSGEKISSILSRVSCIDVLNENAEDTDVSLPVGDLPMLLGMTKGSDCPAPLKLTPSAQHVEKIKLMLAEVGPPPYIGVTWRAGTKSNHNYLFKYIDEKLLANTIKPIKGTVLILQRLPENDELKNFLFELGREATDLSGMNEDLEDMLALLSVIDVYVGVSNTNMHLCAGLGKPCNVLVPNPPEWRWMNSGSTSPWYPGFHVYHQSYDGGWKDALDQLTCDLECVEL